jgi:Uma2 family endonuclease
MAAMPQRRRMTEDEYLAIENAAPFKSDFHDGEMYAMAGASPEHNLVKENLSGEIYTRLRGSRCRSLSSDQRVRWSEGDVYNYPDIVIFCGPFERAAKDRNTLTNPTAVIDVLSPSTETYDRGVKFREYQQQPTMKEIVFVSQTEMVVEVFARQPDGKWLLTTFADPAGAFRMDCVPGEIPLAAAYRDVLPAPPP